MRNPGAEIELFGSKRFSDARPWSGLFLRRECNAGNPPSYSRFLQCIQTRASFYNESDMVSKRTFTIFHKASLVGYWSFPDVQSPRRRAAHVGGSTGFNSTAEGSTGSDTFATECLSIALPIRSADAARISRSFSMKIPSGRWLDRRTEKDGRLRYSGTRRKPVGERLHLDGQKALSSAGHTAMRSTTFKACGPQLCGELDGTRSHPASGYCKARDEVIGASGRNRTDTPCGTGF